MCGCSSSRRTRPRRKRSSILKQLMIHLLREDREGPVEKKASNQLTEAIHEIANYIRQNPGIAHRVEDLATRAQLSPRYFSIKFKEMIGIVGANLHDPDADRTRAASAHACRDERDGGGGRARVPGYFLLQPAVQAVYGKEPVGNPLGALRLGGRPAGFLHERPRGDAPIAAQSPVAPRACGQ